MRNLQARDLFTFSKMITKMELKEQFKGMLDPQNKVDGKPQNLGIDVIMLILENVSLAENEFYEFIAPIAEKTPEESKEMPFKELKQLFANILNDADFASFFK